MFSQLLARLTLLLARIVPCPWRKNAFIRWLLYQSPLSALIRSLLPSTTPEPPEEHPENPPLKNTLSFDGDTIAFSLFHQPAVPDGEAGSSGRGKLPPLHLDVEAESEAISQLTNSPEEIFPPQQIPKLRLNDDSSSSDIESRGRPHSVASSHSRNTAVTTQSPTHISILPLSSQGRPRGFSHPRSPSRSGTFQHPTRTPIMAHKREDSSPGAVPFTTLSRVELDWLRSPPPLEIREPDQLPQPLGNQTIMPIHPEALSRGECRIVVYVDICLCSRRFTLILVA